MTPIKTPRKLIEVALPLDKINAAAAREKSIRHGHPSTLHLWWARRPLAAARAVIFAQMVNDPSESVPGDRRTRSWKDAVKIERERLFGTLERLVLWENTNNEAVLNEAREEIRKSWRETCELNRHHPQAAELFNPDKLPAFHDPFAGGGALPLEAQRLGLEAYASDLNPVAVTINKAMIEIPPRFAGRKPVGPLPPGEKKTRDMHEDWSGARGLAEDVRRYGAWMRAEAEKRIGHLYPKIEITAEMAYGSAGVPPASGQDGRAPRPDLIPLIGQKLTVIAWLWARTVRSPNPAFSHAEVPLASTFVLSSKAGKEAYVEPVVEGDSYRFTVKVGTLPEGAKGGTKLSRGANFQCLLSDTPIEPKHIYAEANAGRMGARLMAVVAEGARGRVYLPPYEQQEVVAHEARPEWKPEVLMPENPRWFSPPLYGLKAYGDLFTPRQLVALTTFSDLVQEAIEKCRNDFLGARASRPQKTWHSRGYLPHWEAGEHPQSISFRLYDSLPQTLLDQWREELARLPEAEQQTERRKRIETALDAGLGACWLRDPRIAGLIEQALLHFDGQRYRLHAWSIMPNHVHVLMTPLHEYSLSSILHSWKSFTAKGANEILGRTGPFWLEEYFDRAIRDEHHFYRAVECIENNPVKAGLCRKPEDWPFGSVGAKTWECGHPGRNEERAGRPRSQDEIPLDEGGSGALAYAQAVGVYLGFAISRTADRGSTICSWDSSPKMEALRNTFGRQAIPMTWDFAEGNPFSDSSGNWTFNIEWAAKSVLLFPAMIGGSVTQQDSQTQSIVKNKVNFSEFAFQADAAKLGARASGPLAGGTPALPVVSTDPPYYDNIGYADLSDFFYVWLRKSLKPIFPGLYATLAVPKAEELVATPYRHGGKEQAEAFFLDGMTRAIRNLAEQAHPAFPVTIYYAFKQAETKGEAGTSSTGWETFLEAVLSAGFALTGTWPMRTELGNRMIGAGNNALASSIVLVCRKRATDAPTVSRREFIRELNAALPEALDEMTRGGINSPVAPVDLSQAIIGPGMGLFSQYVAVLEADGKPMSVRTALQLINRFLAEDDFDHDTQFCLHWFETQGWAEGQYGQADVLARAKGTSVQGMQAAGVIASGGGKLRLLRWAEYPSDWSPETDDRTPIWEALHQLIRALNQQGETEAGALLARMPARAEPIRALAYRLYTLCERKGWADDARAYNELVTAWSSIELAASESGTRGEQTGFDNF